MPAIGIAGPSGSGKSSVAAELERLLPGAGVLCTDSYYLDLAATPEADRAAVNFDSPDALDWGLLRSHFLRLRDGGRVDVPVYSFSTHTRLAEVRPCGPWRDFVLEGLLALWEPRIRAALDLAVFIDAPESVCLARRIARDMAVRGRTESSVREQWSRDVAPMYGRHVLPARARADLVLDGRRPPGESARAVVARLRGEGPPPGGLSLHSNQ